MPSSSPKPVRCLLVAALSCVLAACGETPAPPAAAAMPASTPEVLATRDALPARDAAQTPVGLDGGAVRDYLVSQYGELAQLQGDWPGTPVAEGLGNTPASREICAREAIGSADAPAELVAVCGVPDGAGHVTTALTDFFQLRLVDGAVVADARQHMDSFGSIGDVADVEVRRFGPRLYGFVVEDGFTGQGITVGNASIVLPDAGAFHQAGSLRTSLDNLGAMEGCAERDDCAPDAGYDLAFELTVDMRDATAAVWPLRVHERGEACGRRVDRSHAVPFDGAAGAWRVPPALQRDSGCD